MKVPWDFSKTPAPGAPATINLPTREGRELGRHLARFCDQEERKQLERFPNQTARRCHDCAFRKGTRPNGCPETLMDATKCIVEMEPFFCHLAVREGEQPRRVCQGWLIMISSKDMPPRPPILLPPVSEVTDAQ